MSRDYNQKSIEEATDKLSARIYCIREKLSEIFTNCDEQSFQNFCAGNLKLALYVWSNCESKI